MSATRPEQLYESDFYAWTQAQAKELRRFAKTRPNLPLDLAHIAEELRDLGKSERDAVFNLAQQILQLFLMIEHSPAVEQRLHWADEIDGFREQIERKLSPTIRRSFEARARGCVQAGAPARPAQDGPSRRARGRRESARELPLQPRADPRRLGTGCQPRTTVAPRSVSGSP
jgi:Domain of unknown function DUF29